MPKIVDHHTRRIEIAEAVGRVIARDGVEEVSIRSVATEAGWSSGALRHYFATRAELLAFACEEVIDRVTARISSITYTGSVRDAVRDILHETMPLDARRATEASIAFSFLALGLSNPRLAQVQRRHFEDMYDLCRRSIEWLAADGLLRQDISHELLAHRLHAVVDGLSLHGLAGHSTPPQMIDQLDAYLAELVAEPGGEEPAADHGGGAPSAPEGA